MLDVIVLTQRCVGRRSCEQVQCTIAMAPQRSAHTLNCASVGLVSRWPSTTLCSCMFPFKVHMHTRTHANLLVWHWLFVVHVLGPVHVAVRLPV
jgi:hypothetical protein